MSGVLAKLNWGLCSGSIGPLGKKSDFFCKNQILLETWQRKSGRFFFQVHRIHFLSAVRWIAHAAYGLLAGGCLNVLEAAGPCHVFLSIGSSQHEVHSFIKPIFLQPIFRITKWFGPNKTEVIKRRWQEYAEKLYQKYLYDPENHDGVITHLEPDILECEVKWALGSITTKKASGSDGIPAEVF